MKTIRSKRSIWHTIALVFWLVMVFLQVAIIVLGLPEFFSALLEPCADTITICQARMQLMPDQAALWSMEAYAWYGVITRVLARLVSLALGILIFVKKPASRMAWITSLYLIIGLETGIADSLAIAQPAWLPFTLSLGFIGELCLMLFFLLFPNERFDPRWTRWFPFVYGSLSAAGTIFWLLLISGNLDPATSALVESLRMVNGVLFLGSILTLVGIIIYRYRVVLTSPERQQTKWVIYAFALGYGVFAIYIILWLALGWGNTPIPPWQYILGDFLAIGLSDYLIPIAITIAITRYQLFDIDLIIRRTVQYTMLSGLLVSVYFGSVVLLQSVFEAFTGQRSPFVIVVSTLVIAALFNPLRQRVQAFVDRRFFRKKYDAEQSLATFAMVARDEVDIDKLTSALMRLAQETMQPEQASLWLPPGEQTQIIPAVHVISGATMDVDFNHPGGWNRSQDGIKTG